MGFLTSRKGVKTPISLTVRVPSGDSEVPVSTHVNYPGVLLVRCTSRELEFKGDLMRTKKYDHGCCGRYRDMGQLALGKSDRSPIPSREQNKIDPGSLEILEILSCIQIK